MMKRICVSYSMEIHNQTNEQLEARLNKHKRTMRLMLIVFVVVAALNIGLAITLAQFEPLPPLVQVIIALPISVINVLSVWWLSLGGKWR